MSDIRPWKIIGSKKLNHYKIFDTRTDRVISPRTQKEHDVYIVSGSSWVNVLAITAKSEIVLVQQYRHGTREIHWEIPGGVIDSGESPAQAATRELLEETGFQGDAPLLLGKVHPNPAYQENTCYTLLIQNVELVATPQMDSMEDILVKLIPEKDFSQMIESGAITHSLVVVADLWRRLWRTGTIQPIVL
jgi:ADP-ribose pyrophosphatase